MQYCDPFPAHVLKFPSCFSSMFLTALFPWSGLEKLFQRWRGLGLGGPSRKRVPKCIKGPKTTYTTIAVAEKQSKRSKKGPFSLYIRSPGPTQEMELLGPRGEGPSRSTPVSPAMPLILLVCDTPTCFPYVDFVALSRYTHTDKLNQHSESLTFFSFVFWLHQHDLQIPSWLGSHASMRL